MSVDGSRYVVNGYPGADWVHNVRAAGEATLTRGDARAGPDGGVSADERVRSCGRFPRLVPTGVDLMKRVGLLTDGTPDEVEGFAGRCPVFRIDPIT